MINANKYYSFLGIIKRAGKIIIGYDAVVEKLKYVKAVIIADDASDRIKTRIGARCVKQGIKVIYYGKSEEYGRALGVKTPVIMAILDSNFTKALYEKFGDGVLFGGENNGEGKSI